jgi:predicted DNA-binding transcriptional regulator AlpA
MNSIGRNNNMKGCNDAGVIRETHGFYCGLKRNGEVKLNVNGKKLLGCGKVYSSQRKTELNGKIKRLRVHKHTSSNYQPDPAKDILIRCECIKTGKPFRFIGSIKNYHNNVPPITTISKKIAESVFNEIPQTLVAKKIVMTSQKTTSQTGDDLKLEMQQIMAQRLAGIDPFVKLKNVCVLVKESKPTLYRKMKMSQFPLPIKRGRQSFWRLSQIEEYAVGIQSSFQFAGQRNVEEKHIFNGGAK